LIREKQSLRLNWAIWMKKAWQRWPGSSRADLINAKRTRKIDQNATGEQDAGGALTAAYHGEVFMTNAEDCH